jgi:hypothetical protein
LFVSVRREPDLDARLVVQREPIHDVAVAR